MRIDQLLAGSEPVFSFEFFPPKTDAGVQSLFETITQLRDLQPAFVSVTYGAGGSTRDRTVELVRRIRTETDIEPMAHLTCVGATRDELRSVLAEMDAIGIDNVLALRGDPPAGAGSFEVSPDGLRYAAELAAMVSAEYEFCVGGACYPEGHPDTRDLDRELDHCRAKVAAGAGFLITQLFFDNRAYFDFVRRARARGIAVPILPGIMPITNVEQVERFTSSIGAALPSALLEALRQRADDAAAVVQLGVAWATLQSAELLGAGAPGVHFYTLNRSPATRAILSALRAAQPWNRPG
ncbi:MAG: methylenetetrahydrofolate reductase [NAD(P)H] [Candidatus Dormibacteria bacterium]